MWKNAVKPSNPTTLFIRLGNLHIKKVGWKSKHDGENKEIMFNKAKISQP